MSANYLESALIELAKELLALAQHSNHLYGVVAIIDIEPGPVYVDKFPIGRDFARDWLH